MKKPRRWLIAGLVLSTALALANKTATGQAPRAGTAHTASRFPVRVGAPPLKYAGPEEGYPPQIVGIQNIRAVPSKPIARRLTDAVAVAAREAAAADSGARAKLGTRFVHVATSLEGDTKKETSDAEVTRVVFYNYDQKTAVEVQLRGNAVTRAVPLPGYTPPIAYEEAMDAVELARQDDRIRNQVQGLTPRVMQSGAHPATQRVARVSFATGEAADPTFVALVDLTDRKVLLAGPTLPRP